MIMQSRDPLNSDFWRSFNTLGPAGVAQSDKNSAAIRLDLRLTIANYVFKGNGLGTGRL